MFQIQLSEANAELSTERDQRTKDVESVQRYTWNQTVILHIPVCLYQMLCDINLTQARCDDDSKFCTLSSAHMSLAAGAWKNPSLEFEVPANTMMGCAMQRVSSLSAYQRTSYSRVEDRFGRRKSIELCINFRFWAQSTHHRQQQTRQADLQACQCLWDSCAGSHFPLSPIMTSWLFDFCSVWVLWWALFLVPVCLKHRTRN